jgi:cytosine/adenosine deaminase-related metal-dependent hydrolase
MDSRAPAILAHMNCLSDEDLRLLESNRGHFSVAHCPRSHAFFHHPPFRLNDLHAAGVNLALGTDSLASNRDLNMFSEMRKMRRTFPRVPARGIVEMATVNGATALGEGENWPRWADWIAVPRSRPNSFDSIIQFAESPKFVMVAGSIVKKMI